MEEALTSRHLRRWGTGILLFACLLVVFPIASQALVESDEADLLSSDEFEGGGQRAYGGRGDEGESREFGAGLGSGSKKGAGVRGEKVVTATLNHDLGYGFVPAGEFTVRVKTSMQGGQKFAKAGILERKGFSAEERAAFEDLVAKDGYYRVQLPGNLLKPSQKNVIASAKARCLAAASFQEALEIHVDHLGNILGLSYKPKADCSKTYADVSTEGNFVSTVAVSHGRIAPRLMPSAQQGVGAGSTAGIGINMPKPGRADDSGAPGDKPPEPEKTFWQKYWLYIVAGGMLVMNVVTTLSSMPDSPPDAAARGGGAARRR